MERYRVHCRIGGNYTQKDIECREMTMDQGSYCFWTGEYGKTNKLIYAFPIVFTIVEGLPETN